ncbi:MAG: heavy metal translocating P-type ATPase, partial [Desulfatiglandales bacterium]
LATPTAIVAGTGLAARRGILFKSGEALEMAASIEGILMDKTGTLTRGKPTVMGLFTFDSIPEEEILALAASLEKASLHPLAKAIVEYANQRGVSSYPVTDFKAKRADGVSGIVNGRDVIIGRPAWLKEEGVPVEQRIEEVIRDSEGRGFSLVMMGVDKRPCSLFLISDEIRDEARHVVSELQGMGIEVVMLTGDNPSSARRVAQEVGIRDVIAPVRADQKVTILESFKGKGKKVGMVGDGINDAPALAKADLGIAIGGGTDIAISAGHVVILGQDIRNIPKVISIGRLTMRHIKENLFWAFGYNVVLIPLAAGVLHFLPGAPQFLKELHPIMAALAMALSSLTVVLNSLRLSHKGAYL